MILKRHRVLQRDPARRMGRVPLPSRTPRSPPHLRCYGIQCNRSPPDPVC